MDQRPKRKHEAEELVGESVGEKQRDTGSAVVLSSDAAAREAGGKPTNRTFPEVKTRASGIFARVK